MRGRESGVGVVSSVWDSRSSSGLSASVTMPRKNPSIALVTQPSMLNTPQSACPPPPPLVSPGGPEPDPPVGGGEVPGCGTQPSPVHTGVVAAGALVPGGVLVGREQTGSGEPGAHESTVGSGN